MRLFIFPVMAILFVFSPLQSKAGENFVPDNPGMTTELSEQDRQGDDAGTKSRYHLLGESLSIFIPIKEEKNIYPLGIGGNILYKTSILNRLFSPDNDLPGIILGFTGSFYVMEPKQEYRDKFGELTIFTLGIYTGYQFLIPVSKRISISPALFLGTRYYMSFHFFEDEISTAYSPIIISGIDIGFIFDNVFSLSLKGEYQVYIEGEVKQTINVSLGSGIYF